MSDPLDIVSSSVLHDDGHGNIHHNSKAIPKRKASAIFTSRLPFWGNGHQGTKRASTTGETHESSDEEMIQDEDLADDNKSVVSSNRRSLRLFQRVSRRFDSAASQNESNDNRTGHAAQLHLVHQQIQQHQNHQDHFFLPPVLCECILYIKANGLQMPGIFRIPGENNRVKALIAAYEKGQEGILENCPDLTVHDVATLLKSSIRNMPEPLVPFPVYKKFLRAIRRFEEGANNKSMIPSFFTRHRRSDTGNSSVASIESTDDSTSPSQQALADEILAARRARVVCDVALTLPPRQCQCLSMVLNLLYIISELSNVNKMTTQALAVVFAPTLMHTPDNVPPETVLRDMPIAIAATKILIENAEALPHPDPILMQRISSACVA